jgi:O-antigen ligase
MLPEILRRTGSFLLFMSMFAFLFVDIDGEAVDAFKAAAILISLGTALKAILFFFVLGGNRLDFAAKDAVGSMHFGYMYIIAFWLLYLSKPQGSLSNLIKMGCIFIILIGTALTFARASIVALAASFLLFLLISLPRVSLRRLARIFISFGIGIGAGIYILMVYFPVILDFFNVRLIQLLLNSTELQNRLAHSGSSEGERLVMWSNIIEYVSNNPITGAGYFGPWIIQARAYLASAHNQYLDILFRTGFLGFFVYLGLLCSISNYLWRAERALFWGLVGTMFFGFFAETFKEGQGAFIFSFFLGMLSQSDRLERESFRLLLPSASIQEN